MIINTYEVTLQLKDRTTGDVWIEKHYNMSLNDFESLYPKIKHIILKLELELVKIYYVNQE